MYISTASKIKRVGTETSIAVFSLKVEEKLGTERSAAWYVGRGGRGGRGGEGGVEAEGASFLDRARFLFSRTS